MHLCRRTLTIETGQLKGKKETIDDSSYRLNFDLGRKPKSITTAKKSIVKLAKPQTFEPIVVQTSARNTKYFPPFTIFRDQTLQFY